MQQTDHGSKKCKMGREPASQNVIAHKNKTREHEKKCQPEPAADDNRIVCDEKQLLTSDDSREQGRVLNPQYFPWFVQEPVALAFGQSGPEDVISASIPAKINRSLHARSPAQHTEQDYKHRD